jgi:membrane-associated phospholipid phosphatase
MNSRVWIFLAAVFFTCAASTYAGTIMVGQVRPAITPDQVKTYWDAPHKYDRIAIITKGSGGSWFFSDTNDVDAAIARIKMEAAQLGANGIILTAIEQNSSGGLSVGIGGFGFPGRHVAVGGGTSVYTPLMHKTVQAEAIYVRRR